VHETRSYLIFKRSFDIAAATLGLIVLSPLFLVTAVLIRVLSSGPVLYASRRVGQHGTEFDMWKFRTMYPNMENVGAGAVTVRGDDRVTPLGRWLRRSKLDELPQLWNVARGEMSFVGPRPELPEWARLYDARQRQVLAVRPGITDSVQILFRHECEYLPDPESYESLMRIKVDKQLEYLGRGRTTRNDFGVLLRTGAAILKRAPNAEAMSVYRDLQ
jgi:lipopolysaccharide/colanic/teichoic acid biosynthesis glycosyltransferase